jgi:hypothetical protein
MHITVDEIRRAIAGLGIGAEVVVHLEPDCDDKVVLYDCRRNPANETLELFITLEDDDEEDDEPAGQPDPGPAEPEEGDLITFDHEFFYEAPVDVFSVKLGRNYKVRVADSERWQDAVKAYMDSQNFWPNVWVCSDHGNVSLLSLEDE